MQSLNHYSINKMLFEYMNSIYVVGFILFVMWLSTVNSLTKYESFSPGKYPSSVTRPLLYGVYDMAKHPKYDENSASDIYVNEPQYPAKHCGTNNVRYWNRPTNGKCVPSGMCMSLYDNTPQSIPPPLLPPNGIPRVNYYVSKS
jgi:hypothetical protein